MSQHPRGWRPVGRRRHAWISLLLVAFLAPHLWVVAVGEERFPFTSAAMFSFPVSDETPRYTLRLTAEVPADPDDPSGTATRRQVDFDEARANPRHLFSHTWGSASPASYHTHYADDDADAFTSRLESWLGGFHRTLGARQPDEVPPTALTLWLQPVHPDIGTPQPIARYDASTGRVTLHPDESWHREEATP